MQSVFSATNRVFSATNRVFYIGQMCPSGRTVQEKRHWEQNKASETIEGKTRTIGQTEMEVRMRMMCFLYRCGACVRASASVLVCGVLSKQ